MFCPKVSRTEVLRISRCICRDATNEEQTHRKTGSPYGWGDGAKPHECQTMLRIFQFLEMFSLSLTAPFPFRGRGGAPKRSCTYDYANPRQGSARAGDDRRSAASARQRAFSSDGQHAGLKNIIGDILLPVVLFQAFFTAEYGRRMLLVFALVFAGYGAALAAGYAPAPVREAV